MADPALSQSELLHAITSANADARDQFLSHFSEQVKALASALSHVHSRFVLVNDRVPHDERSGWGQAFLYAAFDSIVSSAQLLVFGHHIAAGSLMRSWAEAAAVALLFSSDKLSALETFLENPTHYSASKAFNQLQRREVRKHLNLNAEGLTRLKAITDSYNLHSHASPWAISSKRIFHLENSFSLAGEFDVEKLDYYRRELRRLHSAAGQLYHLVEAVERNLGSRAADPDGEPQA